MKKALIIILLLFPILVKAQYCSYTSHAPISINGGSNVTISGYVIDLAGANAIGILVQNVRTLHITKCKIINNNNNYGIKVYRCSNVTIDSCDFENVGFGAYCQRDTTVKFNANRVYNSNGFSGQDAQGHGVQFDNVVGGGSSVLWNLVWNPSSINAHDCIGIYESFGLPGDSIMVMHNSVLMGQTYLNSAGNNGAGGIIMTDIYGSYQVCRYNTVSTSGYAGIQAIGGAAPNAIIGLSIDHNIIYSPRTNISLIGLSVQVHTGSGIYAGYNRISWTTYNGTKQDKYTTGVTPTGWATNISDNTLNSSVLPTPLWAACTSLPVISYSPNSNVYLTGTAITTKTPTNTGGAATSWSINKSLATGLSFSTSTGVISGTPTATKAADTYTITATNAGGTNSTNISMTVNAPLAVPAFTYSPSSNTYVTGTAITNKTPISTGGTIASYSINRALPTGLFFNTGSGLISGTPTATSANTAYVITGTNASGSSTFTINLTVNAPVALPPLIIYSPSSNVFTYGTTITNLLPVNTGGAAVSFSISPSLPAGISFNTTTGLISGTPTTPHAVTNYTVTATNSGGSEQFVISITVQKAPLVITAVSTSKLPGHANPSFDVTYSGFQFSDNSSSLSTLPTVTTNAVTLSPPGVYPLVPMGAVSSNYSFSYVNGVLLIGTGPVVSGTFGGIIRLSE